MADRTGEYYEHFSDSTHKHIYYTFTPKPLMGSDLYQPDEELYTLLIETHEALGILEGMELYMPNRESLQELMLFKEAAYSWLIDNDESDFSTLLNDKGSGKDISAVQNIMHAHKAPSANAVDTKTFELIYSIVMHGASSEQREHIRNTPIFRTNAISNLRQYNPTAPEHIRPAIADIVAYTQQDISNALIKAAMIHYQFEIIHPFVSHNGIVGRVLALHTLADVNHHAMNYLCPSEILYKAKNDYFGLLSSTQKTGGYMRWIKFYISTVLATARQNCDLIKKYQAVIDRDELMLREQAVAKSVFPVLEHWKMNLISTVKQASSELGLAFNTVERSVQLLQSLGILTLLPAKGRTRRFAYSELMGLFTGDFTYE